MSTARSLLPSTTMSTTYSETSERTAWKKSRRPCSIQELAQRADISGIWDPSKDLKLWLKMAENARHSGQELDRAGELEDAFVEYTKAASLILEKIPSHRDYHARLDSTQRDTLIAVRAQLMSWLALSLIRFGL